MINDIFQFNTTKNVGKFRQRDFVMPKFGHETRCNDMRDNYLFTHVTFGGRVKHTDAVA